MITIKGPFIYSPYKEYDKWRACIYKEIERKYSYKGDKDKEYKVKIDITIGIRNRDNHPTPRIEIDNVAKTLIDMLAKAGIFGGKGGKMWDSNVYEINARIQNIIKGKESEKAEIQIYHRDPKGTKKWEEILQHEDIVVP